MTFNSPLIRGRLIKRYKRFLADVELENGEIVTAHCPNTGAMTGCAEPGFDVWLSHSDNPKRKLQYTWELAVNSQGDWIGIHSQRANKLVLEALQSGMIDSLTGYDEILTEVKYGDENSRIDLLLKSSNRPPCYIEVKSVTLLDNAQGFFPDAVSARGSKHLRELALMAEQGNRAVLFFCVQHTGIKSVQAAAHIDPTYAEAMGLARAAGVEVIAWGCEINQEKVLLNQSLPVKS